MPSIAARHIVFDINALDEGCPAHCEWDLKCLAATAAIASLNSGQKAGKARAAVAQAAGQGYASFMLHGHFDVGAQLPMLNLTERKPLSALSGRE